jgi:hypothetical protein
LINGSIELNSASSDVILDHDIGFIRDSYFIHEVADNSLSFFVRIQNVEEKVPLVESECLRGGDCRDSSLVQ